ncbi:MAG: hypothetical protein V3U19_03675 [Thermodesulfobacteriota bacterium]
MYIRLKMLDLKKWTTLGLCERFLYGSQDDPNAGVQFLEALHANELQHYRFSGDETTYIKTTSFFRWCKVNNFKTDAIEYYDPYGG